MYLDQILCLKEVAGPDGSLSKEFSLDVLIANAIPFAGGFCLGWFFGDYIPGINPNSSNNGGEI